MAMVATQQLNYFPAKDGVSPYYSPHVLMKHQDLDYEKHCQVPFGAYVQAKTDTRKSNSNEPRTMDAIYLRPLPNKQGGHEVMNLVTGLAVTASRVWEKPVTDFVIKAVEAMAAEQQIKTLKLRGRNKQPLFPADWTAGVEFEEPQNQNNNDNDDNDEDYEETDDSDNESVPDLIDRDNTDAQYDDWSDDELDDDDNYDRIEQDEIDDLLSDQDPTDNNSESDPDQQENEQTATVATRRSTRNTKKPER